MTNLQHLHLAAIQIIVIRLVLLSVGCSFLPGTLSILPLIVMPTRQGARILVDQQQIAMPLSSKHKKQKLVSRSSTED